MCPAGSLQGRKLENGWIVDSQMPSSVAGTGGHFSTGYFVHNVNGQKAFLKAMDLHQALQKSGDTAMHLKHAVDAYIFERDLLIQCRDKRLKRIVLPLDSGEVNASGGPLGFNKVYYIIFELASGDIRKQKATWQNLDLVITLRVLHHAATGLKQLHANGIAHQDIKPSNLLVFQKQEVKIADLGRASHYQMTSFVDGAPMPGDSGYAPPEQWYQFKSYNNFNDRLIADLYLLGSLLFFYFSGLSAYGALVSKLQIQHANGLLNGEFENDLPYLQNAFASVLEDLKKEVTPIGGSGTNEIVEIARQLCNPDPRRRGDPAAKLAGRSTCDLHGYISRFDRLAKHAELKLL